MRTNYREQALEMARGVIQKMRDNGLTLRQIADRAVVSERMLNNIKAGDRAPSLELYLSLKDAAKRGKK